MTENEAIELLSKHLVAEGGFLPRLRSGRGLDQTAVQHVREALVLLRGAWADRECVPKAAVFAMAHLDDAIASCGASYPAYERELQYLELDLMRLVRQSLGRRA
jgi:hypothetical protein